MCWRKSSTNNADKVGFVSTCQRLPGCFFSICHAEIRPLSRKGGLERCSRGHLLARIRVIKWGGLSGLGDTGAGPISQSPSHHLKEEQDSWGHWGQPPPQVSGTSLGTGQDCDGTSALAQGGDGWGKIQTSGCSTKARVHRLPVLEAVLGFPNFGTDNSYDFRNILQ